MRRFDMFLHTGWREAIRGEHQQYGARALLGAYFGSSEEAAALCAEQYHASMKMCGAVVPRWKVRQLLDFDVLEVLVQY